MYKAAICDDEVLMTDIIEYFINISNDQFTTTKMHSANELKILMDKEKFDVVFLDINMPEISGLEIADELRKLDYDFDIVFITSHSEYALESYKVSAMQYIIKPIDEEKIAEVLKQVAKSIDQRREHNYLHGKLTIKSKGMMYNICFDDLIYFEKQDHNIKAFSKNNKPLLFRMSLKVLYTKLPRNIFINCHQGFIINIYNVESYDNFNLKMINSVMVPVSRKHRYDIRNLLTDNIY